MFDVDPRKLVAMGGGGFMMEPDNLLLDTYLLGLVRKERPRVLFLPTASGDSPELIERFYDAYSTLPAEPAHLILHPEPNHDDIKATLLGANIIYVGGGNTLLMLERWRAHDLHLHLAEAWWEGILLAGLSAGSLCWYEQGTTDSEVEGEITAFHNGLGFLRGSHCPHYDGEPGRRPAYHALIESQSIPPGIAADDGVALRYSGDKLIDVVSSRPDARAYKVTRDDEGQVSETTLMPRYLAGPPPKKLGVRPPRRRRRS